MKQKRIVAFLLTLALLLSWVGFGPVQTVRAEDAPPADEAQQAPSKEDEASQFVDPERFSRGDHTQRLRDEEGDDLNKLVYRNRDGSKTMYLYDHPVEYRDERGQVQDIS